MDNAIGVIRVSLISQGIRGDSPEDQKQQIELFSINRRIEIKKFFIFMDSAAKEQQPVQEAIDYAINPKNKIKYFIIKSIDRFTRAGSSPYDHLKSQLTNSGVKLIDLYGVISDQEVNTLSHLDVSYSWSVYSPSKKTELLEAERGKDEHRDILTRMIGSEIRYVRLGYRVRQAPFGFKNVKVETIHGKRNILVPHPEESVWIKKMFELKAEGILSDTEIIDQINLMGFKTRKFYIHSKEDRSKIIGFKGGVKLTGKYLYRFIEKPIYAGLICEKWTDYKPIKARFSGLVSIDMFNKANRGKYMIIEENDGFKLLKDKDIKKAIKLSRENIYPYKRLVRCPICKENLYASASRGKLGKYYPAYHCSRRGHYFRVPMKVMNDTVINFLKLIWIKDDYANEFREKLLSDENKIKQIVKDEVSLAKNRIKEIDIEIEMNQEKIRILISDMALKAIEDRLITLEQEKKKLERKLKELVINSKDNNEVENIDMDLNRIPKQMIDDHEFRMRKLLFSLLFKQLPTFEELKNFKAKLNEGFESKIENTLSQC